MSYCMLIAADKPLPPCNKQAERIRTVRVDGEDFTISAFCGFAVTEHSYYRDSVNAMGYPIKPYQYELDLYEDEADLQHLKEYLAENFVPGEVVELWGVWTSDFEGKKCPSRRSGTLDELNMDVMRILCQSYLDECWLSITI